MSKYQYLKTECSFVLRYKKPIKYFKEEYKKYNGYYPRKKQDLEIWLSSLLKNTFFTEDPNEEKTNV